MFFFLFNLHAKLHFIVQDYLFTICYVNFFLVIIECILLFYFRVYCLSGSGFNARVHLRTINSNIIIIIIITKLDSNKCTIY